MTRTLSSVAAKDYLAKGGDGKIRVEGLLDLRGLKVSQLSAEISCYDLDASHSQLICLPEKIEVTSCITLDNCQKLEHLPDNLSCGSISLRKCGYINRLPENLQAWFIDLTDCQRFAHWPRHAAIERGIVRLRNCIELQQLPDWMQRLAQLDLAGCMQVTDLPDSLQVSGWIDVGGSGITSLPDNLSDASLHWRGVPVPHRIAFQPQTITAQEILSEENAELRRVLIERMGYLEFAQGANASILDSDTDPGGKRELLHIPLEDDEPIVGLSCFCPSTQRHYFLRVPPTVTSCHQGAAWLAGFDDPTLYKPVIET